MRLFNYLRQLISNHLSASPIKVHIYVLLAMLLWGFSYIWSKIVFEYLEPATTVFFRLIISVVFLTMLHLLTRRKFYLASFDIPLFLLSACFNPFLYFLGENFGLSLVSPTISAVIIATIPVFMPIVAFVFLRERLKVHNFIGLAISFGGVLVMVLRADLSLSASPLGLLFLFGAVASALVYGILLKKLTHKYSPLFIILVQNIVGIFYFLPVVLYFEGSALCHIQPDSRLLISVAALGIFASSLAYVFFAKAVQSMGIARTNIYANLIPVFTAIFSFLIIGEVISTGKFIGMALVIFGVLISQNSFRTLFRKKTTGLKAA